MNNKLSAAVIAALLLAGAIFFVLISPEAPEIKTGIETDQKLVLMAPQGNEDIEFIGSFLEDKKFFDKYGVEVERIFYEPSVPGSNILASGEADVAIIGLTAYVSAYLSGAELKWLAKPFTVSTQFGISRFPKEEAGKIKKAAVPVIGVEPHLILIKALENFGADPGKVEFIAIPPAAARLELLKKGEVDLIIVNSEKFLAELGAEEKYYVFEPYEMLGGKSFFRGIIAGENTLKEKPGGLKKFVFAVYDAMNYIAGHPEETKTYLRQKYEMSEERAGAFYNRFVKSKEGVGFAPDAESIAELTELIKKEFDPTKPERDIEGFIYPDFAREAVGL